MNDRSIDYKGFVSVLKYDEEEKIYYGTYEAERIAIGYEGDTAVDAIAEFKADIDEYIEDCRERGKYFKKVFR